MKYSCRQIMERALKLADLTNTDFLTHEELIDYLNDAFISLFQSIINNGDKVFVKEVNLNTGGGNVDVPLPKDFYQMHSLVSKDSGKVYQRASVSQTKCSNTYDIVNNRLRLNGIVAPLVLTYYPIPKWLSFQDKELKLDVSGKIIDACRDKILLNSGNIYNVMTSEQVGQLGDIKGLEIKLCNDFCIVYLNNTISYVDFNGLELLTIPGVKGAVLLNDGYYKVSDKIYFKKDVIKTSMNSNKVYINRNGEIIEYDDDLFSQVSDFNGLPAYVGISGNKVNFYYTESEKTKTVELDLKAFDYVNILDYGVICNTGSNVVLKSCVPDTLLNFPENIYYEMLCADLGLRFIAKQNAVNEGLQRLYSEMKKTYTKTLGQNAGPVRIINVY